MKRNARAARLIQALDGRHRELVAAVAELESLSARELRLVLRQTTGSLAEQRVVAGLLFNFAGPGLRAKVVEWLLRGAGCYDVRAVYYAAALRTVEPDLVRGVMPAFIDKVLVGKLEPDYAQLLPLLWAYEDYPQLSRLVRHLQAEARDEDLQTFADFLEDHEPDDLLDRIQQWWIERPPASHIDESEIGAAQTPGDEAVRAWSAFTASYGEWGAAAAEALRINWQVLVATARESPDDRALARLVLLPQARKHLRSTLEQLGEDVERRLLPVVLEQIDVDITLTAQGSLHDALASAGFASAAARVREAAFRYHSAS